MSRFKQLLMALVLSVGLAAPAHADMMGVSLDVPVSHSFTDKDLSSDGAPSGFMVGVTLPFFMGLGYEDYKTPIESTGSSIDLTTKMYNVFLDLPFPMLNLVVGAGVGKTNLDCDICSDFFEEGNASEIYGSLGFPIVFGVFDVHVGYRQVSAKVKDSTTGEDYDASGNVTSLGVKFGF